MRLMIAIGKAAAVVASLVLCGVAAVYFPDVAESWYNLCIGWNRGLIGSLAFFSPLMLIFLIWLTWCFFKDSGPQAGQDGGAE